MMNKKEIQEQLKKPLIIKETRVRRLYKGGVLIDRFRGSPKEEDGFLPEDWVGSTTLAVNRDPISGEGISKIILKGKNTNSDYEMSLQEILNVPEYANALFGEGAWMGKTPGILVKLLDSVTRLPLQTHPDKEFTNKYFNDTHGKCESWIVLGGRQIKGENPYVYFGFKENATKDLFKTAYYEQNIDLMISLLNKIYVKPGDIFYIEPNIIHAIGPGAFLLEIQEPTDYVFQFDRKGEYWELNDFEVNMGLGDEIMLNSINYKLKGEELLDKYVSHVDIYFNHESITPLFAKEQMEYFGCDLITTSNQIQREHKEIRIGVVIKGALNLTLNDQTLFLKEGDTYMLPASSNFSVCTYEFIDQKDKNEFFSILEAFPV